MNVGPPPGEGQQKKPYTKPEVETSKALQNSIPDEPSSPRIWERLRRGVVRLLATVLFEPRSKTEIEQLARKILDHARMNRKGSESTVIHVPEVAARFRERRRTVRQSLELLEEQGTLERTDSEDYWKLASRVSSPIRGAYNPPRISGPSAKMLPNPPPGWMELQNRAHRAKDAQEFGEIIEEMNRLLLAHEKAAGEGQAGETPTREANKPASKREQK